GSAEREPLSSDSEARIADFADLVATAIANTAAREQLDASRERLQASRNSLRQLARQQTALRRVAELVAREAEPAEVFNAVAEEMAGCLDVYNATVARYEGDAIVIAALGRPEVELADPPAVGERFPVDGDDVAVIVRRTGRPARMDSYEHAAGPAAARIREIGLQSMVGVPIVVGTQLWGVAAVGSRTGPLAADTEVRIADFADLVATAIANAAAREQLNASRDSLRQLARQQTALRRVAELVAREAEPAAVFNAVAEELAGCLDAYNATVTRYEGDFLVIEALASFNQDLANPPLVGERLPLDGDHVAPMILRTGRPARMDSHEHAAGPTAAVIRALGIQSMVGVPIVVGGQIWGSAGVGSRTGPLPPDTEARMADFADLVATSIANAATRAELQAGRDSLRELADNLSVLARQQAALRRVATLVARGVSQSEVFSAVAEEMAGCLNVGNAEVLRFEDDGATIVVVASYAEPGVPHLTLGERLSTEGDNVAATVLRIRQSARIDRWEGAAGPIAQRVRELGVRSRIGAPIVVDERLWGIAVVATTELDPLPPDTEGRIVEFAELVATAIAAATTRAELIASRARIVAAADDARRRLERDIHDGAQQRLVSLGLKLRLTEDSVPSERDDLKSMLSEAVSGLTDVFQELQELSRGIHPAILSTGGLPAAFKTLARRSPVPVDLDVTIEHRLPGSIEVAAYYVVAEALTNAAKHAQASEVTIRARTTGVSLVLLISDDGIGGADSGKGSGLIGLKDRIEVLGGRMRVDSPPGGGTTFDITIPHKQTEDD
uniref:GAF domain-containing sensor histidine kinase n=1 Tax=Mycobacterium sp. TaxID=1785 RepID=UPI003F9B47EE